MTSFLKNQIQAFAFHLIEREAEVRPRKNKRSQDEYEKFLLSTGWLCRKLLSVNAAHEDASTRISRDKNRYKAGRYVLRGVTYTIAIEGVLDLMEMLGYVEMTNRGHYSRDTGKGDQTRYKPTDTFLKHFEVVSSTLPKQLVGYEDTDPIVLQKKVEREVTDKDGVVTTIIEKKKLLYDDTPQIISWRDNLTIINDCVKRHWADLYLTDDDWVKLNSELLKDEDHDYSPIQLHRATLRRVFNSSHFDEGGRFYGAWWQNIPSAYRGIITIDGKRTTEFDYGRLHPTMLYAQEGMTLSEDAYDIGVGDEHRDVIKQLFNAMVQMKKPQDSPPSVKFSQTGKTWKQLRSLILDKHEPIKDKFFCGIGNRLQFEDSQIAEKVMLHFARQDIAVLPVHDSFVIQRSLQPELIDAMSKAFSQHYNVPIDIKDGAKFLAMDIGLPDEVEVEAIVTHMAEFDGWWRRND